MTGNKRLIPTYRNTFLMVMLFSQGHTLLQLLFGYRIMDELNYAHVDCFAKSGEIAVLLQALFPKKHSNMIPISYW